MTTTNEIGARTEGAVLAALLRAGYNLLVPFGVSRYDLVIEVNGTFGRVQCKTARVIQGGAAIEFNVSSTPPSGVARSYQGQADYFGLYAPEIDQTFLVPIEAVVGCRREARLRLTPTRNNQVAGTRLAEQYRLVAQVDRVPAS